MALVLKRDNVGRFYKVPLETEKRFNYLMKKIKESKEKIAADAYACLVNEFSEYALHFNE
jgi:hypothetical protein